jgi:serine/threonine-protein kinase
MTEKLHWPQRLRLVEAEGNDRAVPRSVGRYKLYEEIAFGGMGAVHLCVLEGAGGFRRPVAIKRLHPHVGHGAARHELRQEAWLGSLVRHPNVVPVLDLVEVNGNFLLVMEFVLGETVARLLRKHGMMPVAVAVAIMGDVLHGLHAAHTATGANGHPLGIVHRDVSPQNILVGVDGVGRILDFGVAKCSWPEEKFGETTEVGFVKGKLGYIAPEQLLSEPLDARTDIFSAGVVLWEALTGRRLFKGLGPMQALVRLADRAIPPPSAYNGEVTPKLDALVARALHRNPQSRFRSAEEFAEQLQTVMGRAHPGRVGRYVEQAAASAIDQQRYLLRCIQAPERLIAPLESALGQVSPQEATTSSFAIHRRIASRRRRWLSYVHKIKAAVGVGVLLLTGAVYGVSNLRLPPKGGQPVTLSASARRPVAEIRAAPATPEGVLFVASAPSPSGVSEPLASTTTSPRQAPAPSVPGKSKPLARAKIAAKRRALSAQASCSPPYRVDSDGIKRIKRGCL